LSTHLDGAGRTRYDGVASYTRFQIQEMLKSIIWGILMEKIVSVLCAMFTLFALSACGGGAPSSSAITAESVSSEVAIGADEGLLSVDITLPASLFEASGSTPEEYVESAKEDDGVIDAKVDADGNVILTVTKQRHQEMLDEMKQNMDASIEEYTNGDFPSIKAISYNDDMTEFDMIVDKAAFENSFDGMAALGIYMGAAMYQAVSGIEEVKVIINCIDEASNEVFDTVVYPEDLNAE
jgi:hypothetical protein